MSYELRIKSSFSRPTAFIKASLRAERRIMHSALFQEFLYIIRRQFVLMRLEAVAGAKYDVEL